MSSGNGAGTMTYVVTKVGLFEFLATPVLQSVLADRTEITLTDTDEFDAPHDPEPGVPNSAFGLFDNTMETRQDGDTYDDDAGLSGLAIPNSLTMSTLKTSSDGDTYDENINLAMIGIPIPQMDGTQITEASSETYDDDGSLEGLSFPTS
jgi:hypothetical protein